MSNRIQDGCSFFQTLPPFLPIISSLAQLILDFGALSTFVQFDGGVGAVSMWLVFL